MALHLNVLRVFEDLQMNKLSTDLARLDSFVLRESTDWVIYGHLTTRMRELVVVSVLI